jgi:hypothetical protein
MPAYVIPALMDHLVEQLSLPVPAANTRYKAASFIPNWQTSAQVRLSTAKNQELTGVG